MKRLFPFYAISGLVLLCLTTYCFGICISRTPEEIIEQSQFVIHGIVKGMRTLWTDDHSRIYTYVALNVLDVFKGDLGGRNEITVRFRGGRGPGGDWLADNQPRLEEGMEVILHMVQLKDGYLVIRGCEDGAYYVSNGMVWGKSGKVNMTLDQFKEFVDTVIGQREEE